MEVAFRNNTDSRQFDIPLTTQYHFITPIDVPGRITNEDFLFFSNNEPTKVHFPDYDVLVESFNGSFKNLGKLNKSVRLPHVHFVNDALLLVVPKKDMNKVRFVGTIQRGKHYFLSLDREIEKGLYVLK